MRAALAYAALDRLVTILPNGPDSAQERLLDALLGLPPGELADMHDLLDVTEAWPHDLDALERAGMIEGPRERICLTPHGRRHAWQRGVPFP